MDDLRGLLIEDDNVTRQEMAELLTKEAFDVIDACDGNRGRVLFESELPDIVITDLRMPGMSGLEVMEIINRTQPEVPVILTTAYGETDVALRGQSSWGSWTTSRSRSTWTTSWWRSAAPRSASRTTGR
jgi:DNA-binding response OmpR family regulator